MPVISPQTYTLLAYAMAFGGEHPSIRKLLNMAAHSADSLDEILEGKIEDIGRREADKQVELGKELNVSILSPLDEGYPSLLAASHDYPPLIWLKGHLSSVPSKSIAVIGPREPTQHGEAIAFRIARYFAEQGWSVVSGLAIGCDTAAHNAALDAGGHTVAVLAHGLQMISPKTNQALAERIVDSGGALVSQYPIGSKPSGRQFVQRDRTQAGLAQGVVMVQSDLTGGSLHAPRAALNYNRWTAVPYPTEVDLASRANKIAANLLITDGHQKEKTKLLRCSPEALERIVVLRSKADYKQLMDLKLDSIPSPNLEPSQQALL